MKKKIIIIVSIFFVMAVAVGVCIYSQRQTTFDIRITIPAKSQEEFVYSDEIISPIKDTITIWAGENLGDTSVVLLPIKVNEEKAYEPTYLTHGMPVEIDVEQGAWFKVGISQQNTSSEDKNAYLKIEGVTVFIE